MKHTNPSRQEILNFESDANIARIDSVYKTDLVLANSDEEFACFPLGTLHIMMNRKNLFER